MENNLVCSCCGKAYKYCNHCGSEKNANWKLMFDTSLCRDLFYAVSDYCAQNTTIDDVKKVIGGHDLNNVTFKPEIQKIVDEAKKPVQKFVEKQIKETVNKANGYKPKNDSTTYKKNN